MTILKPWQLRLLCVLGLIWLSSILGIMCLDKFPIIFDIFKVIFVLPFIAVLGYAVFGGMFFLGYILITGKLPPD